MIEGGEHLRPWILEWVGHPLEQPFAHGVSFPIPVAEIMDQFEQQIALSFRYRENENPEKTDACAKTHPPFRLGAKRWHVPAPSASRARHRGEPRDRFRRDRTRPRRYSAAHRNVLRLWVGYKEERDRRKFRELDAMDWRHLVIWQCEARDEESLERRLSEFLGPTRIELPSIPKESTCRAGFGGTTQ